MGARFSLSATAMAGPQPCPPTQRPRSTCCGLKSGCGTKKILPVRAVAFGRLCILMPLYLRLLLLMAGAASVLAQDLKPVADRLAAQNAIFEEQYESDLRNFPERATAFGDYRYNDKLGERSLAAVIERNQ